MLELNRLLSRYNPATGELADAKPTERRLADVRGCFADAAAYEAALVAGNPLLYRLASVEPAAGEGDLHYGVIAKRNFRCVVVERNGEPALLERARVL